MPDSLASSTSTAQAARPDFSALRKELLSAGIAPGHVRRTLGELEDHFDDLVDEALAAGVGREAAERRALCALGQPADIGIAMRSKPELRSWAWRWPRLAMVFYPLACVAVLPAAPLIVGARHAPAIARWTFCMLLGGFVTVAMLLMLTLSITFA